MTLPLSGTDIRLLENIPFSNDYKHTRYFTSRTNQTDYFINKPTARIIPQANYQKIEGKYYVAVDSPIDDLWKVNYMMFRNTSYNNSWFYCFVTDIQYKNRNTTHVHFEVDVFQTFFLDVEFKPSYVAREHRPQTSGGNPVINTLQEGLDYGSMYDIVSVQNLQIYSGVKFLVIGTKNQLNWQDLKPNPRIVGTIQPLSYYVIPFTDTGATISMSNLPDFPNFNISNPLEILSEIFENETSVNNVATMYVTEHIGVNMSVTQSGGTYNINLWEPGKLLGHVMGTIRFLKVGEIHRFDTTFIDLPIENSKYSGFRSTSESKLLMHPYAYTEITDLKGNSMIVKNEYLDRDRIRLAIKGSIGTSNKVSWQLMDYNYTDQNELYNEYVGIQDGVLNQDTNDLPVLSNQLSAYLQGNKNSIRNQKSASMFNGVMSVAGGGLSVAAGGYIGSVAMAKGGLTGAISGMGQTYFDIKGLQAKQEDISNIPPNINKLGGNTEFDYGNRYNGIWIIKKQIKPEYQKKLEDFFNVFGYKTDLVKIPNFRTRQNWNYIQTQSCTIIGNLNNRNLQQLKDIFDGGITLWHTDDVGNYNLANGVR